MHITTGVPIYSISNYWKQPKNLEKKYGIIVIAGSEVCPPHEGVIWNRLFEDDIYPNNLTTRGYELRDKALFAEKVRLSEDDTYHSISVILHPQAGGLSGRNSLESILAMINSGSEVMEIYNGCWETGDDLIVNDHNKTGSVNAEPVLFYISSPHQVRHQASL